MAHLEAKHRMITVRNPNKNSVKNTMFARLPQSEAIEDIVNVFLKILIKKFSFLFLQLFSESYFKLRPIASYIVGKMRTSTAVSRTGSYEVCRLASNLPKSQKG